MVVGFVCLVATDTETLVYMIVETGTALALGGVLITAGDLENHTNELDGLLYCQGIGVGAEIGVLVILFETELANRLYLRLFSVSDADVGVGLVVLEKDIKGGGVFFNKRGLQH